MFFKAEPKPVELSALDQRAAELAKQQQELADTNAERYRLEAAAKAAAAARERSHADLNHIINDPMRFATTPAPELEAAKQVLIAANKVAQAAAAAHAAHLEAHGDLNVRAHALLIKQGELEQSQLQEKHRAIVAEKVPHLLEVERLERAEHELIAGALASYPEDFVHQYEQVSADGSTVNTSTTLRKGAGVPVTTFASGIFSKAKTDIGDLSALADDVLLAIAAAYPELLPEDRREAALARLSRLRDKGITILCGRPGWQTYEVHTNDDVKLLNGRTRLQFRNLV